jgi:hypothetical protein
MMRREAGYQNRLMEAVVRHNERAADADTQKGAWEVRGCERAWWRWRR